MKKIKLINYRKRMSGFSLLEILVASFIFASVLAIIYGLLNDTLISKKDLELTLTINEQVKNTNEVLQSVMRSANGNFFTDGDFGVTTAETQEANFKTAHLFFVSNVNLIPPTTRAKPSDYATAIEGDRLYVKTLEDKVKKIYVFSFELISGKNQLTLRSWRKNPGDTVWQTDQVNTILFEYSSSLPARFVVPKKSTNSPKSIYLPNQGELAPMDIFVNLRATAINQWKGIIYQRQMDQIYLPLITANPYL